MNDVLYKKLCDGAIVDGLPLAHDVKRVIDEFFESNVCIPKGENRHPYADELHKWIEGDEIQVNLDGEWTDYKCSRSYIDTFEYRIKPSDPVYEYQYLLLGNGKNSLSEKFYTDDEFNDSLFWQKSIKLEETKRERT